MYQLKKSDSKSLLMVNISILFKILSKAIQYFERLTWKRQLMTHSIEKSQSEIFGTPQFRHFTLKSILCKDPYDWFI